MHGFFQARIHWSELPFPSPEDLPGPRIKPLFPALAGGFFTTEPPGKPTLLITQACLLFPTTVVVVILESEG